MTRFTVNSIDVKTSAKGSQYGIGKVTDEESRDFENVTFFAPIPSVGSYVEGSLESNDFKGKVGWKFKGGNFARAGVGKPVNMVAAVQEKAKSIGLAMDRKDESIQRAAIQRDSTLMTVAMLNAFIAGKILDPDDVKADFHNWKRFFEGEANDEGVPFP